MPRPLPPLNSPPAASPLYLHGHPRRIARDPRLIPHHTETTASTSGNNTITHSGGISSSPTSHISDATPGSIGTAETVVEIRSA
ncbi:MAG: hypothetical protein ACTHN5_22510 [Phycisphaerae bacterium]